MCHVKRRSLTCLLFAFVTATATFAADPEPRRPTWFEQVERDRDRGAGRIADEMTWQAQRTEERRDVRLRRARPRGAFDTFGEDRDRDSQIEAAARRHQSPPTRGIGAGPGAVLIHPPMSGGGAGTSSSMAAVAARDKRELAEAKQTLDRSLRAVDAAEARELRLLRRRLAREEKPQDYDAERQAVQGRYEQLRAGHERVYEAIRQHIRGARLPTIGR